MQRDEWECAVHSAGSRTTWQQRSVMDFVLELTFRSYHWTGPLLKFYSLTCQRTNTVVVASTEIEKKTSDMSFYTLEMSYSPKELIQYIIHKRETKRHLRIATNPEDPPYKHHPQFVNSKPKPSPKPNLELCKTQTVSLVYIID